MARRVFHFLSMRAGAATRCLGPRFFDALCRLSSDVGGRTVLAENPAAVNSIGWHDNSIHRDIDTLRTCHKGSFSTSRHQIGNRGLNPSACGAISS